MYILLDLTGEPIVTTSIDGEVLYFDSEKNAEKYAKRNLQKYKIVRI